MWKIEFNPKNKRYYLINSDTEESRIVPALTQHEIEIGRYQQYYDKAHVMREYLNGEDVYHTRIVNGRKFIYKIGRK